jgi:hypothetical protein
MSANAGPDIVEDGIVFYYDTGNTVKSYIGEPTTNLATDTLLDSGWPGYSTLISSSTKTFDLVTSTVEWGGDASWTMFYYDVTAYTGQHICLSATYEYSTSPGGGNLAFVMIGQTTGSQTYLGYSSPLDYNSYNPTPGQQISWNGVIGDGGKIGILTWMSNGNSTTLTSRFSKVQLEVKTHPTQFVNGTRSVTQGLLDMTGAGTINLTNASFTPNAQLTFDGTNDTVSVNSYPAIELVDNVSIEYVYMRLATDPILDVIANKYHSTGWELFCTTGNEFALAGRNGDGTYYATTNAAYTIENNKYYHLIAMKEGLSWRLYVNGQLYASLTANTIGTWSNTGILQIGGEGSGYYPSMNLPILKIYNRVLTTSEVLTNYNALKTRFGI